MKKLNKSKKATPSKRCKPKYQGQRGPDKKPRKQYKIKGNYCVHDSNRVLIALTQGMVGIIDAADYEKIKDRTWYAANLKNGDNWYVFGSEKVNGKTKIVPLHDFLLRDEIEAFKKANPDCTKVVVHHVNHNGLDCRRSNMEVTTNQNNTRHRKTQAIGSPTAGCPKQSVYKGVSVLVSKWTGRVLYSANIGLNGKPTYIGRFDTEIEAALAYDDAARFHYGKYALCNFPEPTVYEIFGSVAGKAVA